MAYTKILVIHNRLDQCVDYAQNKEKTSLEEAIDYAMNRAKMEQDCFETAVNCDRDQVYQNMLDTKRRWGKESRKRKGYHIIQSFAPGEVMPEEAHAVGVTFARRLLGDRYEVIVTTHLDKSHLHNHIVFNSVSFADGSMYRDSFQDLYGGDGVGIRGTSDAVCMEYGLSVIDPKHRGRQYSEWKAEKQARPTIRGMIRQEVDEILCQSFTYKTFLQELRRRGYEVKAGPNVKHTAIRPPDSRRYIRLDSLGDGYTEADIKSRLAAVRTGAAPVSEPLPAQPPIQWLTPGRRYRIRGGFVQWKPRRLRGFQALYFKYLYLLGAVPIRRQRSRMAYPAREEVIKFDRYQRQFKYLMKNRIETAEQLSTQYDAIQAEIDALTEQRGELYRQRRAGDGGPATEEEISTITGHLRALRLELKLCVRIEADIPNIRAQTHRAGAVRSRNHEETDQNRSDHDTETNPHLFPRPRQER